MTIESSANNSSVTPKATSLPNENRRASRGVNPQPPNPMKGPWGFRITGLGIALPDKVVTNEDLTAWMDTSDEWIQERTGIKERRIGGTTSGLATVAAQRALVDAEVDASDIEQVILATSTPDCIAPGTAPAVARELGIMTGAFDLQAVCSGWVYALVVATAACWLAVDV